VLTGGDVQNAIQLPPGKAARAQELADEVVDLFEQLTDRLWSWRTNQVARFSPTAGDDSLWLSLYPVAEVVSLSEWTPEGLQAYGLFLPFAIVDETQPSTEATAQVALTSDYDVDMEMGRITKTRVNPWARRLMVTYSGGYTSKNAPLTVTLGDLSSYAVPTTPTSIKMALLTQVEFMMSRNDGGKLVLKSQAFKGGAGVLMDADLHPKFAMAVESNVSRVSRR
jgi:hypothetical protein